MIGCILYDNRWNPCGIQVQSSKDRGKTWNAATAAMGTVTSGLSASPNGVWDYYKWDSVADIGYVANPNVEIQITPAGEGGTGQRQPPARSRWTTLRFCRRQRSTRQAGHPRLAR